MTDPRRPEGTEPSAPEESEISQLAEGYPPYPDPAYAGQSGYVPTYGYTPARTPPNHPPGYPPYRPPSYPPYTSNLPPYTPSYVPPAGANPAEPLPQYWQQGSYEPSEPPEDTPPPRPPGSPRWLWILAGGAVLLVVGLVIALVIANGSSKQQTAVAPLPPMPEPSTTARPPTTPRLPTTTAPRPTLPLPLPIPFPTEIPPSGETQTVIYSVTGDGRAINITYVDEGGILQTQFNVVLPWSKEVSLASPAKDAASIVIVNVGRDVTCSVTVAGVQVSERTGAGLTICNGSS